MICYGILSVANGSAQLIHGQLMLAYLETQHLPNNKPKYLLFT